MAMSKFLRKRDMYLRRLSQQGRRSGKPDNIRAALLKYRLDNNMIQQQLADMLGCTRCQIVVWERGRHSPSKVRMDNIKKKLNLDPIEYCEIGNCNEEGEKAHLISRAVLPKELWERPEMYIRACRRHHQEFHQIGVESFSKKYELEDKIEKAKKIWAEYSL